MSEAVDTQKAVATLLRSRLQRAEGTRLIFSAMPEPGTSLKDMLAPRYWAHVARELKPGFRIEVVPEDMTWLGELYVYRVGPGYAIMKVLNAWDFEPADEEEMMLQDDDYEVRWGNPTTKFRIIRTADGNVMKDGFADKLDAMKWLRDLRAAQAR